MKNKPICPNCGSNKVAHILYGLPTQEGFEMETRGEAVLGGCEIINGYSPKWHCRNCNHEWGNVNI